MKHSYYLLLLVLLLAGHSCIAQQEKVVIRFVDETSGLPLNKVSVISMQGGLLAGTDSGGYATLPFHAFSDHKYILAFCNGYAPDTINAPAATVYMHPLSVMLRDVVVNSGRVSKILQEPNEYVVDYDFAGDNILVATYSGNNGGHAKLFLVDKDGQELAMAKVPDEPLSLFRSCVGVYYCVCRERFYPLGIDSGKITLRKPYNINLLQGLQQCEQSVYGNLYYRIKDRQNFKVEYGMIAKGDSVYKPITMFEEKDVAEASFEEEIEIEALLANIMVPGNASEAARKMGNRNKWDRGSFAHINMPLFIHDDRLVIFDFFKKRLMYYSLAGMPVDSCAINFEWRQSQLFEILKDDVRDRFYIHRYGMQTRQTLQELNINTATGMVITAIDNPLAEKVKVHNGNIYFLWRDSHAANLRQIYVQRTDDGMTAR